MPKFPPPTPQPPEELGMLGGAGGQEAPICDDEIHRQHVVAGQPVTAHEKAMATAERQTRNAGRAHHAPGRGEAEGLRLVI